MSPKSLIITKLNNYQMVLSSRHSNFLKRYRWGLPQIAAALHLVNDFFFQT